MNMGKSIKISVCFYLCFLCFSFNSNAITYHKNPEQRAKMLEVMDAFCKEAGGSVATFEDSCANSCIIYDRKSGDILPSVKKQCKPQKTMSCQCPQKQCLKDRKCQQIILK